MDGRRRTVRRKGKVGVGNERRMEGSNEHKEGMRKVRLEPERGIEAQKLVHWREHILFY